MFTILEYVGIVLASLIALCFVIKVLKVFYIFILGPLIHKVNIKSYGKWALVTGSTDGIGKEYARQLAAKGCDVILVSRSMDKLKNVAAEIEREFKVQTKVVQIDFSGDVSIYEKLKNEIKDLEIGTLVNNVGVASDYPVYFLDVPDWEDTMSKLVNVNITSMIRVTGIVLPIMVKRGKGIVINLSSLSRRVPVPLLITYAATKGFVTKFSEGLHFEYRKNGIMVQNVEPGYVTTNMSKITKSSYFAPNPKTYVISALRLLGTTRDTHGYFPHSLLALVGDTMISISERFFISLSIKAMEKSRDKILLKNNGHNVINQKLPVV